jgi:hypothetical protein
MHCVSWVGWQGYDYSRGRVVGIASGAHDGGGRVRTIGEGYDGRGPYI